MTKLSARSLVISCTLLGACSGVVGGMRYQYEKDKRESLLLLYGNVLTDTEIYSQIDLMLKEKKIKEAVELVKFLKDERMYTKEHFEKNLTESEKVEAIKLKNNAL